MAGEVVVCRGGECPIFSHCYPQFPNIASCFLPGVEDRSQLPSLNPSNCRNASATSSSSSATSAARGTWGRAQGGRRQLLQKQEKGPAQEGGTSRVYREVGQGQGQGQGKEGAGTQGATSLALSLPATGRQLLQKQKKGPAQKGKPRMYSEGAQGQGKEGIQGATSLPAHYCAHRSDAQPHPAWLGQLFILNNVFVDSAGRVFNRTHLFDHNACSVSSGTPGVYRPNITRVRRFKQLVSLASAHPLTPPPAALFSFLPLLFSLRTTLSALPGVPLALRGDTSGSYNLNSFRESFSGSNGNSNRDNSNGGGTYGSADRNGDGYRSRSSLSSDRDGSRGTGKGGGVSTGPSKADLESLRLMLSPDVLGLEMEEVGVEYIGPNELFFADELIQPLHQRCGRPSRALWRLLRGRHLLPKRGLPLFNQDLTPRIIPDTYRPLVPPGPRRELSQDKSAKGGVVKRPSKGDKAPLNKGFAKGETGGWYVILGRRPGACSNAEMGHLQEELIALFGAERVRTLSASAATEIPRLKHLFNNARFFVSAHGPLLSFMAFMPPGGAVLELRPVYYTNAVYHHLAEACDLKYYLAMGTGNRPNGMRLGHIEAVLSVIREVAADLRAEEGDG